MKLFRTKFFDHQPTWYTHLREFFVPPLISFALTKAMMKMVLFTMVIMRLMAGNENGDHHVPRSDLDRQNSNH